MTQYTIPLCGASCIDQDYITQSQWKDGFDVGYALTPFNIYGVLGFIARTPIIGSTDVICDTVSYCWGPEAEGEAPSADAAVFPFRWKATLVDGSVHYGRTDGSMVDASIALFPEILIDAISISACFDNNGFPVFVIGFKDGHGELRRFIDHTQTLAESITIPGTTPQLWFNGLLQQDSDYWDVVCYYMSEGVLRERIQRDFFAVEYNVVAGLNGFSLKHVDRGSSSLSSYQLMEIHGGNGGKEILSVQYTEAVPTGVVIRSTGFEEASSSVSIASDMAYSTFTPPVAIDGGTRTETTSTTVVVSSDMAYTLSLPVSPVSTTETTSSTVTIASDMAYTTSSRSASGSESVRSYISIASDMQYIDTASPTGVWHTTVPSDLSTEAKKARPCIYMRKNLALKTYTYSAIGDGAASSIVYLRADQVTSTMTWAYVDEVWNAVAASAYWAPPPETITDFFIEQNKRFTNWTFNAALKKFTFAAKVASTDFDYNYPANLYQIRNVTKNLFLYLNMGATIPNAPVLTPTAGLGGTWTGPELVLEIDLTGKYDAGDVIYVYGNIQWAVADSFSLPTNYNMPATWITPVIYANPATASSSLPTASYTFVVSEARTTNYPSTIAAGNEYMHLSDFVTEVALP